MGIYESDLRLFEAVTAAVCGGASSRWIGRASLEEEGVAGVTDSDWFWRGGQRELIVRAAVAENLPTVPTVVLDRDRESWSHNN